VTAMPVGRRQRNPARPARPRAPARCASARVTVGAVLTAPVLFGVIASDFFHLAWLYAAWHDWPAQRVPPNRRSGPYPLNLSSGCWHDVSPYPVAVQARMLQVGGSMRPCSSP
jgi:hypothetical protein